MLLSWLITYCSAFVKLSEEQEFAYSVYTSVHVSVSLCVLAVFPQVLIPKNTHFWRLSSFNEFKGKLKAHKGFFSTSTYLVLSPTRAWRPGQMFSAHVRAFRNH